MSTPNSSFSFEMLGSELDRFLSGLSAHASEYLSAVTASAGDISTTLKNVMPRMTGDFAVDLTENETSFIITCELPGIEKENISIQFLGPTNVLIKTVTNETVKASSEPATDETAVSAEAPADTATYHLHEIKNQSRERTVILPANVTCKGAGATFKNGILELILPKAAPDEGITIKIE